MGFQSRRNPNFENIGTPNLKGLKKNDIWVQARGQAQRIL